MAHVRKQEQETAGTEVTEVGDNVLRMQLPIQMPGLGHVNTYALFDDRGVAIVDPGLPGPATWTALQDRFTKAGIKVRDVHTVVVTHSHPDHFGTAARLAEEAGADVMTHAAFRNWWHPHSHEHAGDDGPDLTDLDEEDVADVLRGGPPWGSPTPWGGKTFRPPLRRRIQYQFLGRLFGRRFGPPAPTQRLKHGAVTKLAGREWFAVHTPGHTLDHLCLHDPEGGLLLSGDHVLPTITPHISGMNSGRDPLALYFSSLDRVDELENVTRVLPAHGHPWDDLHARTQSIREHHADRLEQLVRAAKDMDGPQSVEEFSHHLFRRERWGPMAESETYAHLEHLRFLGRAERVERDGRSYYDLG